ncbi:MAG: leucine-rich repeat domain-containing protein [Spirochaetaceae bacterium]|jgi:hypothetical protein|nr:leucine-rich repeat domain-containing protein [Spirochaetaceae bacterium]
MFKSGIFSAALVLFAFSLYGQQMPSGGSSAAPVIESPQTPKISDFDIQGNDDGTMTILNYKGLAKNIIIPEKIFNMPVTRIREGAFKQKGLVGAAIPKTVTFIGDETFYNNQLTAVTLPEILEYIGDSAFAGNMLGSVAIPSKVAVIGNSAFANNRLTAITIPNSVTYIGTEAFRSNPLTAVTIGSGVLYIGAAAFIAYDNGITTLTLGSNIRYIGSEAFYDHRVANLVIPNSVVYIGTRGFGPFYDSMLKSVTIGKYVMLEDDRAFASEVGNNFDGIYKNNDKLAGKYVFADNAWTFTPRP